IERCADRSRSRRGSPHRSAESLALQRSQSPRATTVAVASRYNGRCRLALQRLLSPRATTVAVASRYNGRWSASLSGERVREAFRRAGARGFQPSAETRMPTHESDVCIIGGGITSAMLAQKLSELRPSLHITVVEAGRSIFDVENRGRYRERAIAYGEHPWPDDYVEDQ